MKPASRKPGGHQRTVSAFVAMVVFLVAMLPLGLAALDVAERALLEQAETVLRAAEADLQAAQGSAGTADRPATGSRLRLTRMRIDSARQRLGQAAGILAQLPADDAAVAAGVQRHDAAVSVANAIDAMLQPVQAPAAVPSPAPAAASPAAPAATAGPAPAPAAAASAPAEGAAFVRLDHRQEEALRNARFNLREAETFAARAQAVLQQTNEPGALVPHREVRAGLGAAGEARTRLTRARAQLAGLPVEHPQVETLSGAVAGLEKAIVDQQARLESLDTDLRRLTSMEFYPHYDADFARLQDLARRYGNFHAASEQPLELARIVREDTRVLAEVERLRETYQPLMAHEVEQGVRLERLLNHFQSQRSGFAALALQYRDDLPGWIEADLAEAARLAEHAVSTGRPAFFGVDGGVTQRLQFAEDKLLVLQAFGDELAAPSVQALEQVRTAMALAAQALEEQIIADNRLPEDRYRGPDREAIIARALDAWAHQQAGAEILGVRLPAQSWIRETRWEWFNGAFHKVDRSRMQVQLVVRHDDRLAVLRPVNVFMDHLKGDSLSGHPLFAFDEPVPPQLFLSREHAG